MNNTNKRYKVEIGAMPFTTDNCTRNQFRLIANLNEKINIDILQKAVDLVIPRFPMFTVNIKKRWNSLVEYISQEMLIKITEYKSEFIPFEIFSEEPLFRIMYGKNFVCVEMFHTLSDANGCLTLLNSILSCYFELLGCDFNKINILTYDSECTDEEFEDGYIKYAAKEKALLSNTKSLFNKSFKLKCNSLPNRKGIVKVFSFDSIALKTVANNKNLSVQEYLVTALCQSFNKIKEQCKSNKIIRIQMAIDFRKRFASKTLRNFVGTTQFETKSIDETSISQEFKKHIHIATNEKQLKAFMWSAVSLMQKTLRFFPRFIGNILLRTGDKVLGEKANSTSLSNLGLIKNDLAKCGVTSYEFIEGTPLYIPFLVSVISFNGICNMVFSKNTTDDNFEKYFLQNLEKDNIPLLNELIR